MKTIFKLLAVLGLLPGIGFAQVALTFPTSVYSGTLYEWQWTSSGVAPSGANTAYYVEFSAHGYNQTDLAAFATNSTNITFQAPAAGSIYLTIWYQPCGGCAYTPYEVSFAILQGATIVSPATGSTVYQDAKGGLTIVVSCSCPTVNISAGYSRGGTDFSGGVLIVNTNGGSVAVPMDANPLPFARPPDSIQLYLYVFVTIPGQGGGAATAFYYLPPVSPGMSTSGTVSDPMLTSISDYSSTSEASPTGLGGIMYGYAEVRLPKGKIQNPNVRTGGPAQIERTEVEKVYVKRADLIDIGNLTYSNSPEAGLIRYTYTFDNRQVANLALGDPEGPSAGVISTTQPKKWTSVHSTATLPTLQYAVWGQWRAAELSPQATYSVLSNRLPGLVLMRFQSDSRGFVSRLNGVPASDGIILSKTAGWGPLDQLLIANASTVWGNSLQKLVIGPVFDQTPTMDDVMAQVKIWATTDYGATFLSPLLTASEPRAALDSLTPQTQLERDIVACLRGVFAVAKD